MAVVILGIPAYQAFRHTGLKYEVGTTSTSSTSRPSSII
jgi:hypothetical protein